MKPMVLYNPKRTSVEVATAKGLNHHDKSLCHKKIDQIILYYMNIFVHINKINKSKPHLHTPHMNMRV